MNRIARNHLAHVDVKLTQLAALRAELQRLVEACEDDVVLATCSLLSALSHDD